MLARPEPRLLSPTTVAGAVHELALEGSVALAGGTWLATSLRSGSIEPSRIVHLGRVGGLRIERSVGDTLELGACLTMHHLARSGTVAAGAAVLAHTAGRVANARIRSVATLGGTIALGDGRQDLLPVLMALGGRVRLERPGGVREVPIAQLYVGARHGSLPALTGGELITRVVVARVPSRKTAYLRFSPGSVLDYPTVGVAASVELREDGTVAAARVAFAGVAPAAFLSVGCARALNGMPLTSDTIALAAEAAAEEAQPQDDRLGSADYKRSMTRVWTRRALEACL